MGNESITDILDNLRASEGMLKILQEGEKEIRLRTEKPSTDVSIYITGNDVVVKPSEPIYVALRSAFQTDVYRWIKKLQDALAIEGFDPRLLGDK